MARKYQTFALDIRKLIALAFLESHNIYLAFDTLQNTIHAKLFKFFDSNYVNGKIIRLRPNGMPIRTPSLWSIAESHHLGLPRTQNSLEGWHNKFNSTICAHHIGVFRLIGHRS